MSERKQLGTAKITENNRIYIPPNVVKFLRLIQGDYLSFEKNENNHICIFKGHLRFLRKSNSNYQQKRAKEFEVGEKS